jgi:hypothetical protein
MSRLFYKWLRCELVHRGSLPIGLSIEDDDTSGLLTMRLSGEFPISISSVWYHSLVLAVIGHPVNGDVFPDQDRIIAELLERHRRAGQRVIGVVPRERGTTPGEELIDPS